MERSAASFLIRLEATSDGSRPGTVTSVQTGEHAPFDGFADLARILERWARTAGPLTTTTEERTAPFPTAVDEAP